jgi:hypothetical protein
LTAAAAVPLESCQDADLPAQFLSTRDGFLGMTVAPARTARTTREEQRMAKSPSKSPSEKVTSTTQRPTATPLPRGADPAGQANNGGASQAAGAGVSRQGSPGASPQNGGRPSADEIARRAYERYQARGGQHGNDQQDWYAAERELSGKAGGHQ